MRFTALQNCTLASERETITPNRYECIFAKMAEQLENTCVRCKQGAPEISLWSLNNGKGGGNTIIATLLLSFHLDL